MNNWLFILTLAIDFCATSISLWLAFYIFGKGFPSKIALRATIVFLALFVFFFGAYNSLIHPAAWWSTVRALAILITLAAWYSLTLQLLTGSNIARSRFYGMALYVVRKEYIYPESARPFGSGADEAWFSLYCIQYFSDPRCHRHFIQPAFRDKGRSKTTRTLFPRRYRFCVYRSDVWYVYSGTHASHAALNP